MHVPTMLHASAPLQTFMSAHDDPGIGVFEQPVIASHASAVHTFMSSQLSVMPVHACVASHVSAPLHGLLSAHDVPGGSGAFTQPVAGAQLSIVHRTLSSQFNGVPAAHAPFPSHVSAPLQRLLSAHEMPAPTFAVAQPVVVAQKSVVHALPSLHTSGVPA